MSDLDQGNTEAPTSGAVTPAKMDAALKGKWVEALRSGEYQQAKMKLRNGSSFCCLGVLCQVAGLQIDEESNNRVAGVEKNLDGYGPIYELLGNKNHAPRLWAMNDGRGGEIGRPFSEIADYIEENL